VPTELDTLVTAMLAKDPEGRPTAQTVYETLLPLTTTGAEAGTGENRDPTRPFRWPLLAPPAAKHTETSDRNRLTDAEVAHLLENVRAFMESDRPAGAIGLLEDGIERVGHDPALKLRLRHRLGAALFYAGEYTRAAAVLDAAGRDYRRYFPPGDPEVLDCAYHAGYAYAETGKPGKALPQLRFFAQNADTSATGGGAQKVLEARFVIAQLLAADGHPDDALAEFQAVRPLLVDAYGLGSAQVHNLDKQARRLAMPE
jgi:tetratricopeptide (TPR) repeat protein